VRFRDAQNLWVGSAISGFGFIYNDAMLRKCRIAPPARWDDLADSRFANLVTLADPSQSGSAAAAYLAIACSGDDWPSGWAKLLAVLANARQFTDSAGAAANAPVLGESLVATCIDFYGATRVAEAPDDLKYITPRGQTTFTPDPISILRDAPSPQLAQRFIRFVLSRQGQALWAYRVGEADGPLRRPLGRQPIRRDIYADAGPMLPYIVNPYESGSAMTLTPEKKRISFSVLRELVFQAAVVNRAAMASARSRLDASGRDAELMAEMNRLPQNVATLDAMAATADAMKDPAKREQISRGWRDFFAAKYARIAGRP
jgi:hypothetical protein